MATDQEILYKIIGTRLKKRRLEAKMTQIQLANRVDLSRTSIANIEAGHQSASIHLLYEICRIFGAEPKDILPTVEDILQSPTALAEEIAQQIERSGAGKAAQTLQNIVRGQSTGASGEDAQNQGATGSQ